MSEYNEIGYNSGRSNGRAIVISHVTGTDIGAIIARSLMPAISLAPALDRKTASIIEESPQARAIQTRMELYVRALRDNGKDVPERVVLSTAQLAASAYMMTEDPFEVIDIVVDNPDAIDYFDPSWVDDQQWKMFEFIREQTE